MATVDEGVPAAAEAVDWLGAVPPAPGPPQRERRVDRGEWLSEIPVPPEREKAFLPPVTFQVPAAPYGRRNSDLPLSERRYGQGPHDIPLPRDWGTGVDKVLTGQDDTPPTPYIASLDDGGSEARSRRPLVMAVAALFVGVLGGSLLLGGGSSGESELPSDGLVSDLRADLNRVTVEKQQLEAENGDLQGRVDVLQSGLEAEAGDNTFTAIAAVIARESFDRCTAALNEARAEPSRSAVDAADAACEKARADNDALNAAVSAQQSQNGLSREQVAEIHEYARQNGLLGE